MEKNKDEVRSFYSSLASSSFFFPVPLWSVFAVFDAWLKMTLTSFFFLFCFAIISKHDVFFFFLPFCFQLLLQYIYLYIDGFSFIKKKKKRTTVDVVGPIFFFFVRLPCLFYFPFPISIPWNTFFFWFYIILVVEKKKKKKPCLFFKNLLFLFYLFSPLGMCFTHFLSDSFCLRCLIPPCWQQAFSLP